MSLDTLFEGFHDRKIKKRKRVSLEKVLPHALYCFGTALNVMYESDKRDPGDPKGYGAQGHWKLFTHDHGKGVKLYGAEDCGDESLEMDWPKSVAWLGKLTQVTYIDVDGKKVVEDFKDMDLWVFEDKTTLMGISRNLDKIKDLIIWKGGDLHVEWRGIVK